MGALSDGNSFAIELITEREPNTELRFPGPENDDFARAPCTLMFRRILADMPSPLESQEATQVDERSR